MNRVLAEPIEKAFQTLAPIAAGDERITQRNEKNVLRFILKQIAVDNPIPTFIFPLRSRRKW